MKVIRPYVEVEKIDGVQMLKRIEWIGRLCTGSRSKITDNSYIDFLLSRIGEGHESILEHEKFTARFIVDRGVSHEIVRHRLASFTQESTRYCNYSKDQYENEITVIEPFGILPGSPGNVDHEKQPKLVTLGSDVIYLSDDPVDLWFKSCWCAEKVYMHMTKNLGASAQWARSVLPNSLKTEIIVTANLREWRHIFGLRCAKAAHPQMRQVMIPLFLFLKPRLFPLFEDISYDESFPASEYASLGALEYGR